MNVLQDLENAKSNGSKRIAILLDPDKTENTKVKALLSSIDPSIVHYIFVGGSQVPDGNTQNLVRLLKQNTSIPVVLFPGSYNQISLDADALLYLSLISGRNSEFLIEQHVKAVPIIKNSNLEIIPTSYLLIGGTSETSVSQVSQTSPMQTGDIELIENTVLAGVFQGKKLTYLEAGSGAKNAVPLNIVESISKELNHPLIVGGGIRSFEQVLKTLNSGADLVVLGTVIEDNPEFILRLKNLQHAGIN